VSDVLIRYIWHIGYTVGMNTSSTLAWLRLVALGSLAACSSGFKDTSTDGDRDGTPDGEDCDPADPDVYPGAAEVCDGVDQDCDGAVDNGVSEPGFYDGDGDGYGDAEAEGCAGSPNFAASGGDCDDADPAVHPGATDPCDAADNDCDGAVDEDGATTIYRDFDADGYGDSGQPSEGCASESWSVAAGDCDDYDPAVSPGATEVCNTLDDDCDGEADGGGVCPCDVSWWPDTAHAYMFCTTALDWQAADDACAAYGYRLVTFDSAAEGEWVEATVLTYPSGPAWWIGFTDRSAEGSWAWADGSPVTYTNWSAGEPNNSHGGECDNTTTEEDCGMVRWSGSAWNDYPCTCTTEYSVCEAQSEARPD